MFTDWIKNIARVGGFIFFGGLTLFVIALNVLLFFFFFQKKEGNKSQKTVCFAGYANGTMVDYKLEVYEDSTYFLSTTNPSGQHDWAYQGDTLLLKESDKVCAKIVNETVVGCFCREHHSLKIMSLKSFSPAQVITYPTPK